MPLAVRSRDLPRRHHFRATAGRLWRVGRRVAVRAPGRRVRRSRPSRLLRSPPARAPSSLALHARPDRSSRPRSPRTKLAQPARPTLAHRRGQRSRNPRGQRSRNRRARWRCLPRALSRSWAAAWGSTGLLPGTGAQSAKTITHGARASAHRLVVSLVPSFILMRRIDLRYHSPTVLALNSPTLCRPQVRRSSGPRRRGQRTRT